MITRLGYYLFYFVDILIYILVQERLKETIMYNSIFTFLIIVCHCRFLKINVNNI